MSVPLLQAAAEFLERDAACNPTGLHQIRVRGLLLDRREIAALLRAKAIEERIEAAQKS